MIPRETPRREQLIRAQAFCRQGLVDYIPWKQFGAGLLEQKLLGMLSDPGRYVQAIADFRMTGIDTMRRRLQAFRSKKS